jgi:hypothetical protein
MSWNPEFITKFAQKMEEKSKTLYSKLGEHFIENIRLPKIDIRGVETPRVTSGF